jgi:hypothetical protein
VTNLSMMGFVFIVAQLIHQVGSMTRGAGGRDTNVGVDVNDNILNDR